ncbi:Zinc finger BED domain-containing protein 4 [Frankliniella fusca]|uniref:Zinc finger BED domain-containing protein 4 n=1 Tax=Frankliniella fusca TaxID=407009 RepID=A0AAE1L829_9NEOP|nr:Zinc finger BED domain-containing protein 4 [Frankliniella fusca]
MHYWAGPRIPMQSPSPRAHPRHPGKVAVTPRGRRGPGARPQREYEHAVVVLVTATPRGRRGPGARPQREHEHAVVVLVTATPRGRRGPGARPQREHEHAVVVLVTATPRGRRGPGARPQREHEHAVVVLVTATPRSRRGPGARPQREHEHAVVVLVTATPRGRCRGLCAPTHTTSTTRPCLPWEIFGIIEMVYKSLFTFVLQALGGNSPQTPAQGEGSRASLSTGPSRGPQLPSSSAALGKRKASETGGLTQATLEGTLQRSASFQAGGVRDAQLRDALLYMEMKQNLPLSLSDGEGFKYFVSKAVPLWKPPSRRTITGLMEDKFEVLSSMVKKTLSELPSLCLTADCWTESHTTTSYLGVTVHYPTNTDLHSACVGLIKLEHRHTGEYLAEQILKFCADWSINPLHVEAVITDNADNIKLAVKKAFGESKLLTCFDHTLNLVPRAALFGKRENGAPHVPGVPELIKKMKDIVTYSHTSNNFSNELKRIQISQYNKTEGTVLRLLQDVVTRWGSTYIMIERFLALQPVVVQAAASFPDLNMLSAVELATARSIMDILAPFHRATSEMGAEKSTTIGKVLPMISNIMKKIERVVVPAGNAMATQFKAFVTGEMLRRFGGAEQNLRLAMATTLDPRFIKAYFQSPLAVSKAQRAIELEIEKEMVLDNLDANNSLMDDMDQQQPLAGEGPGQADDLWSAHTALVEHSREATASDDIPGRARSELKAYLQREIAPITKNPLVLWESLKPLYPYLYRVARKKLTVLATSVPSERFFSKAGIIMDDQGSRLTSQHLLQRLFLSSVSLGLWEAPGKM